MKDYEEDSPVSKKIAYSSREYSDISLRPYLEVTYTEGAPESVIGVNKVANVTEAGVGDVIGYSIVVNNTGDVNLTNVQAYDDITAHLEDIGTLEPGQNYSFNLSYRATEDDIRQKILINNVSVNGTDSNGTLHHSFALAGVEMISHPSILVQKTADRNFGGLGVLINYTILVNNTGDVVLENVTAYDNLTGHLEDIGSLAPGENFSFNTSYQIAEGDLNKTIFNKVVANGTSPCGGLVENSSIETVDALVTTKVPVRLIVWNSGIEFYNATVNASALRPSAWDAIVQSGISYTYSDTEWGIFVKSISGVAEPAFYVNGAMADVGVDSYYVNAGDTLQFVGPNDYASGQSASILYFANIPDVVTPGASFKVQVMEKPANGWSWAPRNSSGATVHINPDSVTGADGWTGDIVLDETGTYQAFATKPGCLATNCLDGYFRIDALNPAIEVNKTADRDTAGVGQVVTYAVRVNNTGDVALHNITASDNLTGHVEAVGDLAPGDGYSFVTTYKVLGIDIGTTLVNNVTVSGFDPVGGVHSAYSIETVDVADTVTMRLMVFNNGSLVFNNEFDVAGTNPTSWDAIKQSGMGYDYTDYGGDLGIFIDRLAGVGDYGWGPSFWVDGVFSEWGCSNWHIHEGELDQWVGPNYATGYLASILYLAECPETVDIGHSFRIKITEMPAYGAIYGYVPQPCGGCTVVVGNQQYVTGSDGYTNNITLDEYGSYCVYATKPGYLATYWLGAATPEEGVSKIQYGSGGPLFCGLPVPGQNPAINVTMASNVTRANVGDVIGYSIVVNNTGDVNLDHIVAADSLTGHVEKIGYLGSPGTSQKESYTYKVAYKVNDSDLLRNVTNTVAVNGTSPYDVLVENSRTVTVATATAAAGIDVKKTANVTEALVGGVIGYSIFVNNTGDVAQENVTAYDNLTDHVENIGVLAAGAGYSFNLTYKVAEHDLCRPLVNNVTANGTTASGVKVESFCLKTVNIVSHPALVVSKIANVTQASLGDVIGYSIFVNNTGDVALDGVVAYDNITGHLEDIGALAPGENRVFNTSYRIAEADLNKTIFNKVVANGTAPCGGLVENSSIETVDIVSHPAIAPVANFSASPLSGDAPLTVQFTDLSTNVPTSWSWDFNNDSVVDSIEQNPSHEYASVGTYDVKLTVNNSAGSDDEVKSAYIVTKAPLPFTYTSDGSSITITGYLGPGGNVIIPGTINGLPVTNIGSSVFRGCTALTSVTIPDSVTSIGTSAFRDCTALTSVTISSGITSIGTSAFRSCTALTSMIFKGNAPTTVSSSWAQGSTNLVVYYMEGATSFTTPTWQGRPCYPMAAPTAAFSANVVSGSAPMTVQFTDQTTGAVNLYEWDFDSDGVVDSNLRNPVWTYNAPGTYTVSLTASNPLGSSTETKTDYIVAVLPDPPVANFSVNKVLGQIPMTVQFTDLTTNNPINWTWDFDSDGVVDSYDRNPSWTYTTVGNYTVTMTATNLLTSNTVVKIDYIVAAERVPWSDFTYTNDGTAVTITGYIGPGGDVVIPSSIEGRPVTSIGQYAFYRNTTLTSVTIPDSVTTIDSYAFQRCTALASLTLGSGVTSIGDSAFGYCTALTAIDVDASNSAYSSIDGVLYNNAMTTLIQCPLAKASIVIPAGVEIIGESAFEYSTVLTSVTIPDSVTTIGRSAFHDCTNLASVTIPDSVTSIGGRAFQRCTALASLTLGSGVTSIGNSAFQDCTALTSLTIPDSVTTIDSYAFQRCTALASLTLGSGVTSIGDSAFDGCTALTSLTIPNSVTSIGYWSFRDCTNLASMTFEGNAPTVVYNWVQGCTSLVVYYYDGATGFTTPTWQGVPCYPLATAPVAGFSANVTSGVAPLSVQFTDLSTRSPTAWSWDFNNDSVVDSAEQNPAHTYDTEGNYTVSLTVSNDLGSSTETRVDYIAVFLQGRQPVANDKYVFVVEAVPRGIILEASDADEDPLTYEIVENPAHGTLSGTAPDVTYTSDASYIGEDSFTFRAFDGTYYSNTATVSIIVGTAGEHSPWAAEVVDYKGPFGPSPYDDPDAVLGKPSTRGPGFRIKLVEPAYGTDAEGNKLITSLGPGAYITVKFDHPVENDPNNPYGIDLLVFGNSFFTGGGVSDNSNMDVYTLKGGIFEEPVTVAVSQDNVTWYTYAGGPYADSMFPTHAYQWNSATHSWTDTEMDFTRPVDPSLTLGNFAGLTGAQAIALYDGSGGGTGYDLGALGLDWIQYVKVTSNSGEIDAFADVAPQQEKMASIAVNKTANVTEALVGDVIGYSIVVNNTGDVALENVTAYDNLTDHVENIGVLAAGAGYSFNLTYKVAKHDLCRHLVNNVTANGTTASGVKVESFSLKTVNIVSHPALVVNKIANVTEAGVGDVIGYTIFVNNTGDVALKNVTASDNLTGQQQNIGALDAGGSYRFVTTYKVLSTDMGKFLVNNVTSNGTSPCGILVNGYDTASVTVKAVVPGVAEAVEYILSCQNPDGGFATKPGGSSDYKLTADAAVALAQTGDLGRATKGDMLAYLSSHAPPTTIPNYPGNLGRHVMGIVAAGGDPHDLDGTDYVQMLKDATPAGQLFADSYIIMGLTAAGESDCQKVKDLIAFYLQKQGPEGGWSWMAGGSDVDTTGMVVSALVKAGVDPSSEPIQKAMAYLRGIQDVPTGGFSMGSGLSPSPNSNSCGLAIMAINAGGENSADWVTSSGKNPIDFMLTCQKPSGVIWWKPDSAGSFLLEETAFGALAMDGGFMPTVILERPPANAIIVVNKTANLTEAEVGDVIGYTVIVNNTGVVALENVTAYDNLTGHIEPLGLLSPGESRVFNTTYRVVEADLCHPIVNNASVNGTAPGGVIASNFSIKTVEMVSHPAISLSKTANVTEAGVGDVVGYTIIVNNTGDVALENVTAYDNLTGHVENVGFLAPSEGHLFNTTYRVTKADINRTLVNNVTANGTCPCGALVRNFSIETVEVVTKVPPGLAKAIEYVLSCQNPDGGFGNGVGVASSHRDTSEAVMALVLTGDLGRATKGDFLGYLAANPPSTTLPNYAGNLGRYVMGIVAAGGNPYEVGGVNYVELLKSEARKGHNANFFSEALVPLGLAAAGDPGCAEARDSIAYLKSKQGASGNWVGVDATGLVICAMISCGEDPSSEPIHRALAWFASVQNADGGFPADPGGASNSNSENLAIMVISATGGDPSTWVKNGKTPIDHLLSCQQDSGQIWWKPDNAGYFPMQSTAWGAIAFWGGWLPTATCAAPAVHPAITVIKTANVTEAGVGDVIGYSIFVNNTGDVALKNVTAYDNLTAHLEDIGTLALGENFSFNLTYQVTEDRLCRLLVNNVTANGTSPSGTIASNFSIETVEIVSHPAISVSKTANVTAAGVGDFIGYTIFVNNTGDVALKNVSAYDNLTGHVENVGFLAPSEGHLFNTTYRVTKADINRTLVNNVTANGTGPCGGVSAFDTASVEAFAVNVMPVELLVWNNGTVVFDKSFDVTAVKPTAWDAIVQSGVGHTYSESEWGIFVTSISGVAEPAFYVNGAMSTVGVDSYNVSNGDRLQFVGPNDYASGRSAAILYLADVPKVVNAGRIFRIKVMEKPADGFSWSPRSSSGATLHLDGSEYLTDTDGWTGNISIEHDVDSYASKKDCLASYWLNGYDHIQVQHPQLVISKTANLTTAKEGDFIGYTIWVNNTGNVDLEAVTAYDNLTGRVEPIGTMAPGATHTFSTVYRAHEPDLCRPIVNIATANGTASGGMVENFSIETVQTAQHPAINVHKTANVTRAISGDVIGYTIFVNNTGDVNLEGVTARDDLTGCVEDIGALAPGGSYRFATTYQVTEADISTTLVNKVIANGTGPCSTRVSAFDTASVKAVALSYDFGDAPDLPYPTLLAHDGARHVIDGVTYLGSAIDSEADGQPDPNALGDDGDDGVVFVRNLVPGGFGSVETTASSSGKLDAWIDFNRDGDWSDAGEQIFADEDLPAGTSYHSFAVPMDAVADDSLRPTFARFRFSTAGGLGYSGSAPNGEVEDYSVRILNDTDGDGAADIDEGRYDPQPPDRDNDGIFDYEDYDPSGYFYDETAGKISIGGRIAVTGPGQINIVKDGSDGYYEFWTDGTPGMYLLILTYPPGRTLSSKCRPHSGSFDPTGGHDPTYMGSGEFGTTGYIKPFDCQNNPYYMSFTLEPGDPIVLTNNIPLSNLTLPDIIVTKTADKSEVKRGGDISYTIQVNNALGMPLHNVVVKDVFNKPVELVSASPTSEDGIWRFPEISAGNIETINLRVTVPESQDFEFSMKGDVTGEGFMNVANDYSTSLESYAIENCVYVTSDETGDTVFSDCKSVTVSSVQGTALSTREHGSGSYKGDELVRMRTENKSISMDKDMSATYSPASIGLYNNRTIGYTSKWTEGARAKNWVTGASMSEYYRHATAIDRESRFDLDKNGSTMDFNTTFEGTGHVGVIKTSRPHVTPDVEFREDYSGSFKTHERVDEYGSSATTEKSASGAGFVSADKRVKKGQRSYEYGTGTYGSEEKIETSTNYIAKNISLEHQPHSNESLKWKEGIWSRTPGTSLIGEKYTDIDRLNKETVASGLNEIQTEAEFSGAARYRAVHRNSIDIDQSLIGDYSIKRHLLIEGVPKFDHPHLVVKKSGDLHYEDEAVLAKYSITLENDGDRSLAPIYVKDIFPPLARYINSSIRPSELTAISANWTLTHLAIGDRSVIDLWLDVTDYAGDELVNRVEASGVYNDTCVTAINFTALEIDWLTSNLARTVAVSKSAELIQDQPNAVRYNLTIQNLEESTRVARVTDPLPQGMRFLDASVTPSSDYDGVLTWNLIELGPFETKTIIYEAEALRSGTFVNRAEVDVRAVNGTSVLIQYATAIIDVGGLNRKGSAADWQSPAWGFNLTCEDCDLEPSQPTLEDEL